MAMGFIDVVSPEIESFFARIFAPMNIILEA